MFAKKSNADARPPDVSVQPDASVQREGVSEPVDGRRQELNELLSIQ